MLQCLWEMIEPFKSQVILGPNNEESSLYMDGLQSVKIDIAAIHRINSVLPYRHFAEHSYVMNLARCDRHICRDRAAQVTERVPLNSRLCLSKFCPRGQGNTEIDGRGIKGRQRLLQFDGKRFIPIKPLSNADQNVPKILQNAVNPSFVGVGESCPANRTTKSDVLEFVAMGIQACFNVPQAFATRKLGICQAKGMVEGAEAPNPVFSGMPASAQIKVMPGKKLKHLPENGFDSVHGYPPRCWRIPSVEIQIENEKLCQRALIVRHL